MELEVLHLDPHILVVNKPGGLPSVADRTGDACLLDRVRGSFAGDLELPHRLDRPVSGALAVARSREALIRMNALFAGRAVAKRYWAVLHGTPPDHGMWRHHLVHDARAHRSRVISDETGAVAELSFRKLAQGERYALMELSPTGGVFHQLRAQCGAAGFPIKGDVKYGARRGEPDRTVALHAYALSFVHPIDGVALNIIAPAPRKPLWDALAALVVNPG